jgi:hypothetical protein
MMAKQDDVSALAAGWLSQLATGDSCSKKSSDGSEKSAYPFRPKINGSKVL